MDRLIYTSFVEFIQETFNKTPEEMPTQQLEQLKMAFYGGAATVDRLYGDEIIVCDYKKLTIISIAVQAELIEYGQEFNLKG